MSHSVRTGPRWWLWALRAGSEKFSDSKILKTTTVGPLQYDDYYTFSYPGHLYNPNMDAQYSIISPDP